MPSDFAAKAAGHPFRTEGAAVTLHVARVAGADCYCRRHAAPVSLLKMKQYACMQATLAAIAGISAILHGLRCGCSRLLVVVGLQVCPFVRNLCHI